MKTCFLHNALQVMSHSRSAVVNNIIIHVTFNQIITKGLKFSGVTGFLTMFQKNIGKSRDIGTENYISENIGMI